MRGSPAPLTAHSLAELPDAVRAQALRRWRVLRPHLEDGVPLARAAGTAGVALRTAQRWLTRYRADGLAGLARSARSDRGTTRLPEDLRLLIEGLALRPPEPSAAHVHRVVVDVAKNQGWPVPSYATVYAIVRGIDPAMRTLALDGDKRYREVFDLIHRREAAGPNEIWQADHTQLDLWVIAPSGKPARPWLTVIEDDHSRAIAGYAVNLGAPSAIQTALALRQAIWRKGEPGWHVCGIPGTFYTDHGSDFTSQHMEQVAADLKIRLMFSGKGRPRGRGKIERYIETINQMCLPALPGYAPRGTKDRAGQARLSLAELDVAIGRFVVAQYNQQPHSETGQPPQARWDAAGFLPRLPTSMEQLDLLLLTIAKPRKVHPDGIHLFGLRYLDVTVLGEYVGEPVTIRYDPRDVAEIRVFHDDRFLCRAICPELATQTIGIKEISAARNARRRGLAHGLTRRASVVDRLLAVHQPSDPTPAAPDPEPIRPGAAALKLYRED
ncbi:Mu transposase C-terminal domain-containing protein [Krasilnikovia sp. MM14-A1259]|uniref:Mu transposase C-terminal domain-containing protein n=1 Tax=Krasilnikovia sp. MM14-A1259 TaxID=3373539 RepID=UPI00399C5C4D